jgi:hypothetical protein
MDALRIVAGYFTATSKLYVMFVVTHTQPAGGTMKGRELQDRINAILNPAHQQLDELAGLVYDEGNEDLGQYMHNIAHAIDGLHHDIHNRVKELAG